MAFNGNRHSFSAGRLFLLLVAVVAVAELLVMWLLPVLAPGMDSSSHVYIDAGLLVLLIAPFVWLLVVRPMRQVALSSHALAHKIMDTASDAILTIDEQGRIATNNPATEKIFGYAPGELGGRTITCLLSEPLRKLPPSRVFDSLLEQGAGEGETTVIQGQRRDGSRIDMEMSLGKGRLGKREMLVVVIRDVSERMRAVRELRAAEGRFRALVEQSLAGIYIADDERILYANPRIGEMLGYSQEELAGLPLSAVALPEDWAIVAEQVRQRLEGETTQSSYEFRGMRKNGTTLVLRVAGSVAELEGRRVLIGVVLDVTEQRQAESDLRESEEKFREITAVLGEGVYVLDNEGRLTFMNPAAERMLGWKEGELLGRNAHDAFHYMHTDGSHFPMHECPVFNTVQSGSSYRVQEDSFIRRDGSMLPVAFVAVPILRDGKVVGSVATFHDITERKQHEQCMQGLAYYDNLTGLPNRQLMQDRLGQLLAHAKRHAGCLALLFLDLDGFKAVNDTYGHATGDHLLKAVAERLVRQLRTEDTVSRFGGDEFVVLLPDIPNREAVITVAGKLCAELRKPFAIDGHAIHVSASIGGALFPDDAGDEATLMRLADQAMYRAKLAGKDSFCFHGSDAQAHEC